MSKNIMTSGIEMEDVIKATGFPVPSDLEGKTFAEVVEGGGSGDVTVVALSATENKVYSAPEGKAYSPVTVNVPISTTVYAWEFRTPSTTKPAYKDIAVAPNDLVEFDLSKFLTTDTPDTFLVKTEDASPFHGIITSYERISDTSFKVRDNRYEYVYTRDSTKDFTLW